MTEPCKLEYKFGKAFQAEYDYLWRVLHSNLDRDRALDEARMAAHYGGSVALTATLGPFGALIAAGADAIHRAHTAQNEADRRLAIQDFDWAVEKLCRDYERQQRNEAEYFRWLALAQSKRAEGVTPPSWPKWHAMTEAERLEWLPAEKESLAGLRARIVEREENLRPVKAAVRPYWGYLVTADGRVRRGPWVRI